MKCFCFPEFQPIFAGMTACIITTVVVVFILVNTTYGYKLFGLKPISLGNKWQLNAVKNSPVHLERMIAHKKIEVDNLLRRHQAMDDPLFMRMSYMANECKYVYSLSRQCMNMENSNCQISIQ